MKLLFLVISLSVLVVVPPVVAQDNPSPVTFEQLQRDYLYQLDQYRAAERRFQIDKAEFTKLQTLASREKAVESMKPYLEARAMVLYTYLVALEFMLNQSQGIDVTAKQQTADVLNQGKRYMLDYIDSLVNLTERDQVNQSSAKFESEGRALALEGQFRAMTLLATGRVARVYDQLNLATNDFRSNYLTNVPSESVVARIERGLKDVDYHNSQADAALKQVIVTFPPPQTAEMKAAPRYRAPDYSATYSQSVSKLQAAYSSIRQSLRFLKELARQV